MPDCNSRIASTRSSEGAFRVSIQGRVSGVWFVGIRFSDSSSPKSQEFSWRRPDAAAVRGHAWNGRAGVPFETREHRGRIDLDRPDEGLYPEYPGALVGICCPSGEAKGSGGSGAQFT